MCTCCTFPLSFRVRTQDRRIEGPIHYHTHPFICQKGRVDRVNTVSLFVRTEDPERLPGLTSCLSHSSWKGPSPAQDPRPPRRPLVGSFRRQEFTPKDSLHCVSSASRASDTPCQLFANTVSVCTGDNNSSEHTTGPLRIPFITFKSPPTSQ